MGKGKGGKNKKRGKKGDNVQTKRELLFKDEEQEYAQVLKMLGNGRLEAKCVDGKQRLCHIRGKFRKRVWINVDDIILLGLRSFEDGKADVIHKFNVDEALTLQAYGEIPTSWIVGGGAGPAVDAEAGADNAPDVAFGASEAGSSDDEEVSSFERDDATTMQEKIEAL